MSEPTKKTEQTVAVLINNQERVEMINIPGNETTFLGTVLTSDRGRGLLPGLNLVDPAQLGECRKNKGFDSKFSTKIQKGASRESESEYVGHPMLAAGKELPAGNPFGKLPDQEARELIERINGEELCAFLLAAEARSEIRSALTNRLQLLRTGAPAENAL